jgi:hypothetical protein
MPQGRSTLRPCTRVVRDRRTVDRQACNVHGDPDIGLGAPGMPLMRCTVGVRSLRGRPNAHTEAWKIQGLLYTVPHRFCASLIRRPPVIQQAHIRDSVQGKPAKSRLVRPGSPDCSGFPWLVRRPTPTHGGSAHSPPQSLQNPRRSVYKIPGYAGFSWFMLGLKPEPRRAGIRGTAGAVHFRP